MCKQCGIDHAIEFEKTTDGFREICPYIEAKLRKEGRPYALVFYIICLALAMCFTYDSTTGSISILGTIGIAVIIGGAALLVGSIAFFAVINPLMQLFKS